MSSRTDAATFLEQAKNGKIDAAEQHNEGENILTQDQRRTTMNTMNASYFIEKVGHGILNAFLLAALPTALITTLIQAF
jgi:hypothetical protein